MKLKFLSLLLCSIVTVSCSILKPTNATDPSTAPLFGTQWRIVEIDGNAIPRLVNNTIPYVSFDNNENIYAVKTGCNTLSGSLEYANNKFALKPGISTLMACEDMRVEDGFKKVLTVISGYKINKKELLLVNNEKQVKVKLVQMEPSTLASLTASEWELDLLAEPGVNFKELFPTTKPTIKFGKDGNASGNSGCNRYTGSYKLNGSTISIGAIAGTKMMCPSLEGENTYLKALSKVNKISVNDNVLTMIMGDIALLRFKKK